MLNYFINYLQFFCLFFQKVLLRGDNRMEQRNYRGVPHRHCRLGRRIHRRRSLLQLILSLQNPVRAPDSVRSARYTQRTSLQSDETSTGQAQKVVPRKSQERMQKATRRQLYNAHVNCRGHRISHS